MGYEVGTETKNLSARCSAGEVFYLIRFRDLRDE